uniref:Secreted protein n=1 Tax=Strongyloides papillosus TaxID=174720 RepID=A0A0N5BNI6_STREA
MTHFIYHSFLIFSVFLCLVRSQTINNGSVLKQRACNRIKNLLTEFLTCEQLTSWFDYLTNSLADGKDINTTISGLQSVIMGSLTSSQNSTIVTKKAPLVLSLGISGTQNVTESLISVITNNLMPLGTQIESLVQTWIRENMDKNVMYNHIYYYALTFLTKKRIKTIFKRYKHVVGDSKYNTFKSAFGSLIKFDLYPV